MLQTYQNEVKSFNVRFFLELPFFVILISILLTDVKRRKLEDNMAIKVSIIAR